MILKFKEYIKEQSSFNPPRLQPLTDDFCLNICKKLNFTNIKYLDKGHRGKAYVCDNKIVKISTDLQEFVAYIITQHNDLLVKTYNFYIYENYYIIVMERLFPLTDEEINILSDLFQRFEYYEEFIYCNSGKKPFPEWLKKEVINFCYLEKPILGKLRNPKDEKIKSKEPIYNIELVLRLTQRLYDIGSMVRTSRLDDEEIHTGNLMKNSKGDIVLLDFRTSLSKDECDKIIKESNKIKYLD